MNDEIDCDYTKEIVCPYCGYKHYADSEDYGGQDDRIEQECNKCEKVFQYTTDYDITFSSIQVPCLNEESPHNWKLYSDDWLELKTCRDCGKEERVYKKDKQS